MLEATEGVVMLERHVLLSWGWESACVFSQASTATLGMAVLVVRASRSVGPPLWSRLTYLRSIQWNIMEFCTDIHFPLRTNCNFGDPLTFLVPSSGQHLNLSYPVCWFMADISLQTPRYWYMKLLNLLDSGFFVPEMQELMFPFLVCRNSHCWAYAAIPA